MKLFYKNEKGELAEATPEHIFNRDIQLFLENGSEYKRPENFTKTPEPKVPEAPAVQNDKTKNDPVLQLAGMIGDLTKNIQSQNAIKDQVEEMKEKLAAYEQMSKKGFHLPTTPIPENSPAGQKMTLESLKYVNLAIQGQELMRKRFYSPNQLTDEKREKIAEYFSLVWKAGVEGRGKARDEFDAKYGTMIRAERKTAIGDSGNTFQLPDEIESEILTFARESSIALQEARVIPMASDKKSFNAESASASVGWGNTTSQSDPTVAEVEMSPEELSAYSVVRNTTLDDSPSDIVGWLFSNLSEATGLELDNGMFNGDGTGTYASCSGILSAAAGYSVTLGSGSTAFSQLSASKLSEMIGELDGLRKMGAKFYMHGSVLHFVRDLKDSQNRPIFLETVGSAIPARIWGYPYRESTKCPETSASNTAFMVFGNLKYFLVGRRKGIGKLQVDPWGLWATNRTRFKIYSRYSLDIGLSNGFCRLLTS